MSLQVNAQSQGIGAALMQKADKDQNGQLNAKELPAFVEALLTQIFGGQKGQGQAAAGNNSTAPLSGIAPAPNPGVDQFTPKHQGAFFPQTGSTQLPPLKPQPPTLVEALLAQIFGGQKGQGQAAAGNNSTAPLSGIDPAPNPGGTLPPVQKKAGMMGAQNGNISQQDRNALLEKQLEKISQVQARADIGQTQPGDAKILEEHLKLMKSNPDLFMPPNQDPTSLDGKLARSDFKNEVALVNGGVGNLKGGANGFGPTDPALEGHIDYLKKLTGKDKGGQVM